MAGNPKQIAELEINQVDDGFMIYQPEKDRVHYLNHSSVLILEFCNGKNSSAEIAELLKKAYHLEALPEKEVNQILNQMKDEGLVE